MGQRQVLAWIPMPFFVADASGPQEAVKLCRSIQGHKSQDQCAKPCMPKPSYERLSLPDGIHGLPNSLQLHATPFPSALVILLADKMRRCGLVVE